jgi:other hect domain ubiquitin protein ligase E3
MRRPLRVNDHTEAKRVAYIICDNKLPNGAVIPDASHNWNSLEIEEIFVGENVLVKLPKGRGDFCTPLLGWGSQESRLAKVVFIDTKNSSVLVRYRVEELALFSFTWVPINALMAVEKEVMHISTKSIYEELEKKLEGIIYMHAKQCLTKLAAVS